MDFDRQKSNILSSWWWTVDRLTLFSILLIIIIGTLLVSTSSVSIAERIGLDSFYFIKRQLFFLSLSLFIMLGFSLISPLYIRRISVIGFIFGLFLLLYISIFGVEINGASRWLSIFGISIQPSEFLKPFFVVVTAWMLSEDNLKENFNGYKISTILYAIFILLLISQPDFGMSVVVSAVWAAQLFISGISFGYILIFVILALVGCVCSYIFLPHVAARIDIFIDSSNNINYQVQQSLKAFNSGGIMGKGPGEGIVKQNLPDSHTDFIFAVAGEELGALLCLSIILLYGFVVIRGLRKMVNESNLFIILSVSGIVLQFGIQALVNMGVALNMLPTKGMTLPFISYGGSSMLAISCAMGILLSLTRKRYGDIFGKSESIRNVTY